MDFLTKHIKFQGSCPSLAGLKVWNLQSWRFENLCLIPFENAMETRSWLWLFQKPFESRQVRAWKLASCPGKNSTAWGTDAESIGRGSASTVTKMLQVGAFEKTFDDFWCSVVAVVLQIKWLTDQTWSRNEWCTWKNHNEVRELARGPPWLSNKNRRISESKNSGICVVSNHFLVFFVASST